jgi:hypothetical protein
MTQLQLDKLSELLLLVQENRRAPRSARRAGLPAANPLASAPAAPGVAQRPLAAAPVSPAEDDFSDNTPAPPPPAAPPRRPGVDRRATPLEMAVAGELEQQLAAASEARAIAAPAAEARREPPPQRPVAVREAPAPMPIIEPPMLEELEPPRSPELIEPRIIEPDPPREIARPIAQVMSKHAPPVDATFGAMLKRSLSLRPH